MEKKEKNSGLTLLEMIQNRKGKRKGKSSLDSSINSSRYTVTKPTEQIEQTEQTTQNRQEKGRLSAKEILLSLSSKQIKTIHNPDNTPLPLPLQSSSSNSSNSSPRLNEKQLEAVRLAKEGKSFILTGAAGSGKTFTVAHILEALAEGLPTVVFRDPKGSTQDQEAKPAIALCSFTNRAVGNMLYHFEENYPKLTSELSGNFLTVHKLLEYSPEYYVNSSGKDSMRFVPKRDEFNKLPVKIIIIEEASTIPLNLYFSLYKALERGVQVILLGDINQLPPTYGDSILNYGLVQLPVVELTHIYRQALESPIIYQMQRLLHNKEVEEMENKDLGIKFNLIFGKKDKPVGNVRMAMAVTNIMDKLIEEDGQYDPKTDILLSPFNKAGAGTINLNKLIAANLDKRRIEENGNGEDGKSNLSPPIIYEIVSGVQKHYFAIDDIVYDNTTKQSGRITAINKNGLYSGKEPQFPSRTLSRWGLEAVTESDIDEDATFNPQYDFTSLDIDNLSEAEEKLRQASHSIHVVLEDGSENILASSGEINGLELGYSLTCHKAQGCAWRNVFIIIHDSHFLVNREWYYTACTRARNNVYTFVRKSMFDKMCKRQRIKGISLDEKIQSFNEKLLDKKNSGVELPVVRFP